MNEAYGHLVGRLVDTVKFSPTSDKSAARAWFRLAVNRSKRTDYFNCVAWGKTAENMAQYTVIGQTLKLRGDLKVDSTQRPDGSYNNYIELECHWVLYGPKPRKNQEEIVVPSITQTTAQTVISPQPMGDLQSKINAALANLSPEEISKAKAAISKLTNGQQTTNVFG